jgi:hypothetical protein
MLKHAKGNEGMLMMVSSAYIFNNSLKADTEQMHHIMVKHNPAYHQARKVSYQSRTIPFLPDSIMNDF